MQLWLPKQDKVRHPKIPPYLNDLQVWIQYVASAIVLGISAPSLKNANYRKPSNISRTLVGIKIVAHSDVVGASPAGAAPTTSSFTTESLVSVDWAKTNARRDEKHLSFGIWCVLY